MSALQRIRQEANAQMPSLDEVLKDPLPFHPIGNVYATDQERREIAAELLTIDDETAMLWFGNNKTPRELANAIRDGGRVIIFGCYLADK